MKSIRDRILRIDVDSKKTLLKINVVWGEGDLPPDADPIFGGLPYCAWSHLLDMIKLHFLHRPLTNRLKQKVADLALCEILLMEDMGALVSLPCGRLDWDSGSFRKEGDPWRV